MAGIVLMGQDSLDRLVQDVAAAAKAEFNTLKDEQFAISIWDLTKDIKASFRGEASFYPASVVKLFWLAFAHRQMEDKICTLTREFDRALNDMIRDSSNDATGQVVDIVTNTTGGPELEPKPFEEWTFKRNAANRWLKKEGFQGINVNQKTWGDGPYGRERQSYGPNFENRNALTADATVRMMGLIARGEMITKSRSGDMLTLLRRNNPADGKTGDAQADDYIGSVLPKGAELYSKAGWTSTARHDVAYVKLASGKQFVLAIFTKDHANEAKILPFIAKKLIEKLQ